MNDILPPKRPTRPVVPQSPRPDVAALPSRQDTAPSTAQGVSEAPSPSIVTAPKKRSLVKKISILVGIMLALLITAVLVGFIWYQSALQPASPDSAAEKVQVTVESGQTPSQISELLADKGVIKSAFAFSLHARLSGVQNKLQAGSYRLSPASSTQEITEQLLSGSIEEITITFFPGATLTDTTDKDISKKVDVTTVLKRAGYSSDEITAALQKTYTHPLFASKPASADLEGYIYGETYRFSNTATVEDILTRTFDEFYATIKANNLVAKFKSQGLTLYEGITLASIVQREVPDKTERDKADQKQVAQVFYSRLAKRMTLGSDVTYHYAADKRGVMRDHTLDDPYNTRIHTGLPPGPIAAPGLNALQAVASPAKGDFLFFLSGDDDVTYFAKNDTEHEQNIRDHCAYKCSLQ